MYVWLITLGSSAAYDISTWIVGMGSTSHTVNIIQDFMETFVLSNLFNNLRYGVCGAHEHLPHRTEIIRHSLKPTPMRVNMTNCEITKNAKYRATTARSKRD